MTRALVFLFIFVLAACEASSGDAAGTNQARGQGRAGTIEAAQAFAIGKTEVAGTEAVWAAPTPTGVSTCGLLRLPTGELVAYQYTEGYSGPTALMAINLDDPRMRERLIPSMNRVVRQSCAEHGLTIPENVPED